MYNDIEILQDWIARDRQMRNNSTESDYDKFCEEKCKAIEHIIRALYLATEQISEFQYGCEEFNMCQMCSNFGTENCADIECEEGFVNYFLNKAKEMLKDE